MKNTKNKVTSKQEGKHSFLFWLILPIIMAWLSLGYIVGAVNDRPIWSQGKNSTKADQPIPYFQNHSSFSENLNQPFITLWFDDAWLSQYLVAYPILEKSGFRGTIAIPVNPIDTPGYMNWAQLRILQKKGWETAAHSLVHDCTMNNWNREKIVYEYKTSKFILWKNGLSADIFVTPCGVDSNVMREEAKKMFIGYRTVNPGFNDPKNVNLYDMKVRNVDNDDVNLAVMKSWVDHAKETNSWLIILFHKVGEKSQVERDDEFNVTEHDLTQIVKYIKDSRIRVVVPSQIIASQDL